MSADVTITIQSAKNVLTVPAEALRGTTGDYSVMVLGADGQPQAQAVEVGLVTNTTAEITSGLTEGQAVVTGTASAQNGATATRPAASAAWPSRAAVRSSATAAPSRAATATPRNANGN